MPVHTHDDDGHHVPSNESIRNFSKLFKFVKNRKLYAVYAGGSARGLQQIQTTFT